MAVFYPSLVINFKLRFDESLHVVGQPPLDSADALVAAQGPGAGAVAGALAGARVQLAPEPLILQRGDRNVSYVLNRVPKHCEVELPGYRQAATFSCKIDFRDMPIDPRTLRAVLAEIHLGTVRPDDFARGMGQRDPSGPRRSVLRTRETDGTARADTLVMVGTADEIEVTHTENGSELEIKGRDLRGILLDTQLPDGALESLQTQEDIVGVVQQILALHPMQQQIRVQTNDAEWPNGVVPTPLSNELVPRHRRGARGTRRGGRASVPGSTNQMNFWDAIVRQCYLVGAIPYFDGVVLRIRPSRSIFDQQRAGFDPRIRTPFTPDRPRQVGNGAPFSVRRMIYGRGVRSMHFTRKFGGSGNRPRAVRCISMDTSAQSRGLEGTRFIEARWPAYHPNEAANTRARTTRVAPGGQQAQEEILNIPVPGVTSFERLLEIARAVYEEVGRGEMGGTCETNDLASFGGDNQDPDLLHLRPGDGIEFLTDTRRLTSGAPLMSTLTDHQRNSFEEQVRAITARVPDENLARVIVATSRGQILELQRFFRVQNVKYNWQAQSGVQVAFDFQNYAVAIFGVTPSVGVQPGQVTNRTVPRRTP